MKKGFVSLSILVSMFIVMSLVTTTAMSMSGLSKNLKRTSLGKERIIMAENFVYFYNMQVFEQIKKIYLETPYNEKYKLDIDDVDKMNKNYLNEIYTYLRTVAPSKFRTEIRKEDTKSKLGYWISSYTNIAAQYYNESSKQFVNYQGMVTNSDFRTNMQIILVNDSLNRINFNVQIYYYIPLYSIEDMAMWLIEDEISLHEDLQLLDNAIRISEVRING